jgi:hypothetical protein
LGAVLVCLISQFPPPRCCEAAERTRTGELRIELRSSGEIVAGKPARLSLEVRNVGGRTVAFLAAPLLRSYIWHEVGTAHSQGRVISGGFEFNEFCPGEMPLHLLRSNTTISLPFEVDSPSRPGRYRLSVTFELQRVRYNRKDARYECLRGKLYDGQVDLRVTTVH